MFSCSFFLFFHLFQGVLNFLMSLRSLCGRRVLCGKIQGYCDFTRKFDRAAVHIKVLMCRASSIVIISNTLTVPFPYRKFDGILYNVPSVSEVPRRGIWAEVRSTGARYALLSDVTRISYSSIWAVCPSLGSFGIFSLLYDSINGYWFDLTA